MPTVDQPREPDAPNSRTDAIVRRLDELTPDGPPSEGRLEALALGLVDAVLDADEATLRAMLASLRAARSRMLEGDGPDRERLLGWLEAMTAATAGALDRVAPAAPSGAVAPRTRAHDFLKALAGSRPVGSAELRSLLGTDETQVSRTGRGLLEAGLVSRAKAGRQVFWRLTPRGRQALEEVDALEPAPGSPEFFMDAIRRGYEGRARPEPDPTRRRIIESAMALHREHGVGKTTVSDIADQVGVDPATVESYFPTRDDLVLSCGQHILETLRLPPPERALEMFAGADAPHERARRMVETLFAAYERQGTSVANVEAERAALPLVANSLGQVDACVDALVREAVRGDPALLDPVRNVAGVRAWQELRKTVSHEEAVDEATAKVEAELSSAGRS
ncbi:MAG TPA: TetR family transcriptional regulator [Thermoleophilaceae bacterium]